MFYGQSSLYGAGTIGGMTSPGVTFPIGTPSAEQSRIPPLSRITMDGGLSTMLDAHISPAVLAAYGLGSMFNGVTRPTPLHPSTNVTPRTLPLNCKDQISPYCGWPMSWPAGTGLHMPRPSLPGVAGGFFNPALWTGSLPGLVGQSPGVAGDYQQRDKSPVTSLDGGGHSPMPAQSPDIPGPPSIPIKDYPWLFHSYHPDLLK